MTPESNWPLHQSGGGDGLVCTGLQHSPDAVFICTRDGEVVAVNSLAQWMTGKTTDELLGQNLHDVLILRNEDGTGWEDGPYPVFEFDRTVVSRIAEQDLVLSARERNTAVVVAGTFINEGPDEGLVLITVRRAELRRKREAARADLVSTVSHELRAPLTSVKGFTKTLLAKWDRFSDEQKRQMLETVNEDADRVTRLLGELLAVSRIDAGRLRLKRRMVDLSVLIPQVVERFKSSEPEERRITLELPEALPEVYADPDRLSQVLSNLLENALKYTEDGVSVLVEEHDEHLLIAVDDEGNGIPLEQRTSVFKKFFRGPEERKQGTGLGLYITKGLVEGHGGTILVEDAPTGGARFVFTLPKGGLELAGIDLDALRATTISE